MGQGGLDGLRVLELGSNAGTALLGRMMADHGADVISATPPDTLGLRTDGASAIQYRNKARITLDPTLPEGLDLLIRLSMRMDFLVSARPLAELEMDGCGHEKLAQTNPGLITIALGEKAPKNPKMPRNPKAATLPARHLSAVMALVGALAALQHRHRTGQGQLVIPDAAAAMANMHDPRTPPPRISPAAEGNGWSVSNHPELGDMLTPDITPELSVSPGTLRRTAVGPGADNDSIYLNLLGLEKADLQMLKRHGII